MKEKTKKAKKPEVNLKVRYGITLPECDLMDLLRIDCAHRLIDLGEILGEMRKDWIGEPNTPKEDIESLKMLDEALDVSSKVISMIQSAWSDALMEYANSTKLPPVDKKPKKQDEKNPSKKPTSNKGGSLTEEEKGKIRALRKTGMNIKAIGKEIHRAEKVVADFVRTIK